MSKRGQLGNTGLNRGGGYVYEEYLPELRFPRAARVYKEMADNDATVGAILFMSEMLIRKATWTVEAASDSQVDKDAAKFLEECMHDMDMSWAAFINEVLSMFTYGFSFHEIVYKLRKGDSYTGYKSSMYSDGRIGWAKMPVRSQATLHEWEFADDGEVTAFVQAGPPFYKRTVIPMSKGLLFRTRVTRDNPEGKSLLRNAYRPWYFKKRIEEIEAIGIERDLAGLPTLTPPEDIDIWDMEDEEMALLRQNAQELITSVRRDSAEGLLIPHGWVFDLASTGGSRQFDTTAIIDRYDYRIAITLLSDIVLMGNQKGGSFALADIKKDLFTTAMDAQLHDIADVINNEAVYKLFKLNSFTGMTDLPKIVPGPVAQLEIKEAALLLRSVGLDITKDPALMNKVRSLLDVPKLTPKEFEKMYAQIEQEADDTLNNNDPNNKTKGSDLNPLKDTTDKSLEQNDTGYIRG